MSSLSENTSNRLEQLLAQDTSKNWPNKKVLPFSELFASIKEKFVTQPAQATHQVPEQQRQAQEYLDNGYYAFYLTMLRHDYQPTVEQKDLFKEKLHKLCERLSSTNSYDLFENHLSEGGKLDMDVMFHLMVKTRNDDYNYFFKALAKNEKDSTIQKNYPLLTQACVEFMAQPDFSRQFVTRWVEEVQQLNEKSQHPYWHFEQLQQGFFNRVKEKPECFLKDVSLSESIAIVKKAHTVFDQMNESMKIRHYNDYNSASISRGDSEKIITARLPQIIEKHYKNDIVSRMQQNRENYASTTENGVKITL